MFVNKSIRAIARYYGSAEVPTLAWCSASRPGLLSRAVRSVDGFTVTAPACFLFVLLAYAFAAPLAAAQPAAAQPMAPAASEDPQAKTLLLNMADHLAQAKAFSVSIADAYDVTQPSGQKIEFGENYNVLLSRPDKLRINFADRDGARRQVLFDGQTLTMSSPGEPFYSSLANPGSIDQLIYFIIHRLDTPIPLSVLLLTTAPQEIDKRVTDIALVGEETVAGIPVYHIAARTADIDFQVWLTKGAKPLPVRVVITYRQSAGEPQFSAMLSGWNFAPVIRKSSFVFVPRPGDRQIAIAVPVIDPNAPQNGGDHP